MTNKPLSESQPSLCRAWNEKYREGIISKPIEKSTRIAPLIAETTRDVQKIRDALKKHCIGKTYATTTDGKMDSYYVQIEKEILKELNL